MTQLTLKEIHTDIDSLYKAYKIDSDAVLSLRQYLIKKYGYQDFKMFINKRAMLLFKHYYRSLTAK